MGACGQGNLETFEHNLINFAAEEDLIASEPAQSLEDFFGSGRLIVIEGTDGVGKSTFVENFSQDLETHSDVEVFREPGGTEFSERVRSILKGESDEFKGELTPEVQFLLFSLARAHLVAEKVTPLLNDGRLVLMDRYYPSSFIYQGEIGDLGRENIKNITEAVIGGCTPDVILVLDMSAEEIWKRKTGRDGDSQIPEDINDPASPEALTRVRDLYAGMIEASPNTLRVDANATTNQVVHNAYSALEENLAHLTRRSI